MGWACRRGWRDKRGIWGDVGDEEGWRAEQQHESGCLSLRSFLSHSACLLLLHGFPTKPTMLLIILNRIMSPVEYMGTSVSGRQSPIFIVMG